ncbi:MAG: hypothetical protein IJ899_09995 [Blautia sp.]|nr:hypothetical protein [Blautia sp.]
MKTKYDVGEKVFFKGTVKKIEVFPNGKTAYRLSEYPEILITEEKIIENTEPLQHIADTLERIDEKLEIIDVARISDLLEEKLSREVETEVSVDTSNPLCWSFSRKFVPVRHRKPLDKTEENQN